MEIELYGFPTSPYTLKVVGYLGYKKLHYRFRGVSPINYREINFTKLRRVPVLRIGSEWREDSDHIGLWIDEKFPETALLPGSAETNAPLLEINSWVNQSVIPTMFRLSVDWPSISTGLTNGWKLANAVHQSSNIPLWCRLMWPILVRKAGFVSRIVQTLDRTTPLHSYQKLLIVEFAEKLGDGPFLGGRSQPSLPDVSLYPLVLFGPRLGIRHDIPWLEDSLVRTWISQMDSYFTESPALT